MSVWTTLSHLADRLSSSRLASLLDGLRSAFLGDPAHRRQVAFSVAIIALSAKMAKADGIVTPDEVVAFHQIFQVPPDEARNVERLYDIAHRDVLGFEAYAERIARLYGDVEPDDSILEDVIDGLFHIAKADGVLHEAELVFLRRVATIFGLSDQCFDVLMARHVDGVTDDPYAILRIDPSADTEEIRAAYRKLMKENHPDVLMARGVPEEFLVIATDRAASITQAYETIISMRSERRARRVRSGTAS